MPNHITNVLFITGDANFVEELKAKIYRVEKTTEKTWNHEIGDDLSIVDFNGTVPSPKELEGTTSGSPNAIPDEEKARHAEYLKKYGAVNWYDWNCRNWGTKWNAYDTESVETFEGGLKFKFNTAWSPPTTWLVATAQLYPSLKFMDYYKDEGGGCGVITLCVAEGLEEEKELSDHDWYYQFDPTYKEEYDLITTGDYQKVVDKYKNQTEINYSSLRRPLLDRIENKDLPLFIGMEWYGEDKNLFEKRIKGGVTPTKKETPPIKMKLPKPVQKKEPKTTRKIRWEE
jgi:hypothetical protein